MNSRFFGLCIVIFVILFGCNKKQDFTTQTAFNYSSNSGKGNSNWNANQSSSGEPYTVERTPVQHFIDPVKEKLPKLPFSTNAHREHLNDPLVFTPIPDGGFPDGATAVVGSDTCYFYPVSGISKEAELAKLPKGELIPFATIIPLNLELKSDNSGLDHMFNFQDNYNYFYKTTWGGKQGIVFGADLYGLYQDNTTNRINALLYKTNGRFNSFYPASGYDSINSGILNELQKNGLAIQRVGKEEYDLSVGQPDDMISLYMGFKKSVTPVFVTTDLAAHANHLVFDRMLQYLEENYFFPQLVSLTNEYIKTIEAQKGKIPENVYTTSLLYFQTAGALLALAPQKMKVSKEYTTEIEYQDVNTEEVLRSYPKQVTDEIAKINNAAGIGESSVFYFQTNSLFTLQEDYSQYKARGHYTKNGVLAAYFKALMWYGRINFYLGGEGVGAPYAPHLTPAGLSPHLAPAALFITDITENSAGLKKLWQSLFDPITDLIGISDDISFYELGPLWKKIKGAGFAKWYADSKNLKTFISSDYKELRPPSVSGFSLFDGPAAGGSAPSERLPPVGWRLFGQRYTLDSEIHHYVSPPRLLYRNMVTGLDILKVFGSKTADRLLRERDYANPNTPALEKILNGMQQNLANVKDDYWVSTYYTNILYQIRTQGLFENGAGFYFTEKPGWNIKAMNSAHGTWAELRHDTILYVKQSYAENAGGGANPTFRTKPLPEPVHYIEPNIPFWITSALGMEKMYAILQKYDYLDGKTAQVLAGMNEIFMKAAKISAIEADNKEVSRDDLTWISKIANVLAKLVLTHEGGGSYVDDPNLLRMAVVADVFTNAETGLVLETAVGIPHRLYIPLNDKQGGKRIAIGYGFSYYEWSQPLSQGRFNNDEWKTIVYGDNPDMKQYLPFWMQNKIQP